MQNCYGYVRVSDAKQLEGASVDAQKSEITQFARSKNIKISIWFIEQGTAAKTGRPKFNEMMRKLKAKKVDGVIFHKLDRSARNGHDWATIGDLLDIGLAVYSVADNIDMTTRAGRLMADVIIAFAKDYIVNLKNEVKKGQRQRLESGVYPFTPPIGYLINGDERKGKPHRICPVRGPLVQRCLELYASGQTSMPRLQTEMEQRGLTSRSGGTVPLSGIEAILKNPFYCGIIKIKKTDKTYAGRHEPLVSVRTFERIQDIRKGRRVAGHTKQSHTYRRLFKCSLCRKALIGERQKGHVYYRCHTSGCTRKCLRESKLEAAIQGYFEQTKIDEQIIDSIKAAHIEYAQSQKNESRTSAIPMQLAELDGKLDRLTDAIIDKIIDQETYKHKREVLLKKQCDLRQQLRIGGKVEQNQAKLAGFLEPMKNLASLYQIAEPIEKRQILEFATSNRFYDGEKPSFEPSKVMSQTFETVTFLKCVLDRGTGRSGRDLQAEKIERLLELASSKTAQALQHITS